MKFALDNGVKIINDVSALNHDPESINVIKNSKCFIILMHMQGNPQTMQKNPKYNFAPKDIYFFLKKQIIKCEKSNIKKNRIIIDPGIGFGKTISDNDKIISNIAKLKSLGFPVLIGLSRKSFLQCNDDLPSERLAATISINTLSMLNGADIIRVHDVEEHIKTRTVLSRMSSKHSGELYGC